MGNNAIHLCTTPTSLFSTDTDYLNRYTRNHFSGICSVKSAYQSLLTWNRLGALTRNETWPWIWKLKIPPKINLFIWKCAHHRIPTKSILFSHSTHHSQLCARCNETETPFHVLRDCDFARNIWISFAPNLLILDFFRSPSPSMV